MTLAILCMFQILLSIVKVCELRFMKSHLHAKCLTVCGRDSNNALSTNLSRRTVECNTVIQVPYSNLLK